MMCCVDLTVIQQNSLIKRFSYECFNNKMKKKHVDVFRCLSWCRESCVLYQQTRMSRSFFSSFSVLSSPSATCSSQSNSCLTTGNTKTRENCLLLYIRFHSFNFLCLNHHYKNRNQHLFETTFHKVSACGNVS